MSTLEIRQFSCLKDNYGVLIHDPDEGVTAAIDAPDAAAVKRALDETGWSLTHILVTHHHADHTGGIPALKSETGCRVLGPKAEAARIPGLDEAVGEPDEIKFGRETIKVLDTPGHTIGHISYWCRNTNVAFVGDTLFAMGCGRVLEEHGDDVGLPFEAGRPSAETMLYCGHEYTLRTAASLFRSIPKRRHRSPHGRCGSAPRQRHADTADPTCGRTRDQRFPPR